MRTSDIAVGSKVSSSSVASYVARFLPTFLRDFGEFLWQQIVVGFILALAILWEQVRRGLISTSAVKGNTLSVLTPYLYLLTAVLVWHLARTAFLLNLQDQEQIERLRQDVERLRPKVSEREALSAKALEELEQLINADAEQLAPGDPRITVEIEMSSQRGLSPTTGIRIRNTGGSEIQNLQLKPLRVAGKLVRFDGSVSVIVAGESSVAVFPIVEGVGPLQRHNLALQMSKDWDNQGGLKTEKLTFAAQAIYEDYKGVSYCAEWNYEFYPLKYRMKLRGDSKGNFPTDTSGPFLTVSSIRTRKLARART